MSRLSLGVGVEEAARLLMLADGTECRHPLVAGPPEDLRAAGMEWAAPRPIERVGDRAGDDGERHSRRGLEPGDRPEQGARVRMLGSVKDRVDRALLHD